MKLSVQNMHFEIAEPYIAGQLLGEIEAAHLNELRGARIRGILVKRLAKHEFLPPEQKIALAQQIIAELDAAFELKAPFVEKPQEYSLQDEIELVAREAALDYAGKVGRIFNDAELELEMQKFFEDKRVVREAERRFAARQSVKALALKSLE